MSQLFTVFDAIHYPILLEGETGTGKSTLVKKYAESKGKTCTRINITGQTLREDLIGRATLIDGNVQWQQGILVHALEQGHYILLDEINASLPEVLLVLQALLEVENGQLGTLTIPENNGQVVIPHPDARIFATMNPATYQYAGTKDLNIATKSRFTVLQIDAPTWQEETAILVSRGISNDTALMIDNTIDVIRRYIADRPYLQPFSLRETIMLAELIERNLDTTKAIHAVYLAKLPKDDRATLFAELQKKGCLTVTIEDIQEQKKTLQEKAIEQQKKTEKRLLQMQKKLEEELALLATVTPNL